jgi:3'(2'), 5'-bisphosphate nucleotidase
MILPHRAVPSLLQLVQRAADVVWNHFGNRGEVVFKEDRSPLTEADRASHDLLVRGLGNLQNELQSDWPILSEEGRLTPYEERKAWGAYWLIDPLDGTKEFVRGVPEFTVNLALIAGNRPCFGVVALPAQRRLLWAGSGWGSHFLAEDGGNGQLPMLPRDLPARWRFTRSASSPDPALDRLLTSFPQCDVKPWGSAWKFCMVALGEVDAYPRLGPIMEWDTAAAQIVLEEAGGLVLDWQGQPLRYNKEQPRHQGFVAVANARIGEHLCHEARLTV